MTQREQQILAAITQDRLINQRQLAAQIGISRSAIASHITNLIAKGAIEGRGYVLAVEDFCIAIGGANMDILGSANDTLVKHNSNLGNVSSSAGGVARNIADNLSKLGEKCYLISAVGDDNYGKQLIQVSKNAGIDTSHVVTLEGQRTSCYLSIVDDEGEMQLAIADMKILENLQPALLKKQLPLLKEAKVIVIDTNISTELMQFLFENLPQTDFFVDTVSMVKAHKILPFLSHVHSLKPNILEAQSMSNIEIGSYKDLPRLADWFHQKGVQRLFISLGKDGLFLSDSSQKDTPVQRQHLNLRAKPVVNSNGAGDAMTAALVHCHMQGMDLQKSAYFSLAAAQCAMAIKETINPELSVSRIQKSLEDALCQV